MISNKIADHPLDLFIKESEYIVNKGIRKIDALKVNNDIGISILICISRRITSFSKLRNLRVFL
jgi:hypothetical protein